MYNVLFVGHDASKINEMKNDSFEEGPYVQNNLSSIVTALKGTYHQNVRM